MNPGWGPIFGAESPFVVFAARSELEGAMFVRRDRVVSKGRIRLSSRVSYPLVVASVCSV